MVMLKFQNQILFKNAEELVKSFLLQFSDALTFFEVKFMCCVLHYPVTLRAAEYKCMEIPRGNQRVILVSLCRFHQIYDFAF